MALGWGVAGLCRLRLSSFDAEGSGKIVSRSDESCPRWGISPPRGYPLGDT